MNNYQEFHRLKKQVITNLISIADGSRMDGISNNMLEDKNNAETFAEACELMDEAKKLVELLIEAEKRR